MVIKYENQNSFNIIESKILVMSNDTESENIKAEQEEMKEEGHQLELKEGYEQDEEYEEDED